MTHNDRIYKLVGCRKSFIEATYYAAFGQDLPGIATPLQNDTQGNLQHTYLHALETASRKLNMSELRVLTCIADGIDENGNSLREEDQL